MTTELRSELLDYERVSYEDWCVARKAVIRGVKEEVITMVGNDHRAELLDGGHTDLPERGYFKDDERGIEFVLECLEDPTWETVMWASSMHCGGTYDEEVFEKVVTRGDEE